MSAITLQDIILTIIQSVVLILAIVFSGMLMKKSREKLLPVCFTFAMISFLLSDMYYLIYNILRPDTRMPFAANEIAECAMLLLLSAGLDTLIDKTERICIGDFLFSALYISANIALWIAWSGEWFQDILFGIPYMVLLYVIIRGVKQTKAVDKIYALIIMIGVFVIAGIEAVIVVTGGYISKLLDPCGYALMYILSIFFIIAVVKSMKYGKNQDSDYRKKALYTSAMYFLWTLMVLYMSGGLLYSVAMILNIASIPLMLLALIKYISAVRLQEINEDEGGVNV